MPDVSSQCNEESASVRLLQGSEEWRHARLGKLTASRISDALARTKSGWGASRANLMAALICERLTGRPQETYTNAAMVHGIETEPQARTLYELIRDVEVVQVGFIDHPTIPMSGCSPDGLVGTDGLIEIKCPSSATHIDTLLSERIPDKYIKQVQFQMACTGRHWCDFVSFDPRLPAEMQLFIARVERDPVMIAELEAETRTFLAEIEDTLSKLAAKFRFAEAAE